MKKENRKMLFSGVIIGIIAALLMKFGNPGNMGMCIACFLRDIAGGLGLHKAPPVQYIRPEIIGILLGAFGASFLSKDFNPRGGSNPLIRFSFAVAMMVGALVFLGCPLRMILRLAGGDLNALVGLFGFILGIFIGIQLLKKGYSLGRNHRQSKVSAFLVPLFALGLLILVVAKPAFIAFSEEGPGAAHAPMIYSLIGGAIVGVLLQRTRICTAAAFRDIILIKNFHYFYGVLGIFLGAAVFNPLLNGSSIHLGFADQPIAHSEHLWNFLGMALVGLTGVLLGGCPIRQLILSADGDTDGAITVIGLIVGAALVHNFGLASSGEGTTTAGRIATILCFVYVFVISFWQIAEGRKS